LIGRVDQQGKRPVTRADRLPHGGENAGGVVDRIHGHIVRAAVRNVEISAVGIHRDGDRGRARGGER